MMKNSFSPPATEGLNLSRATHDVKKCNSNKMIQQANTTRSAFLPDETPIHHRCCIITPSLILKLNDSAASDGISIPCPYDFTEHTMQNLQPQQGNGARFPSFVFHSLRKMRSVNTCSTLVNTKVDNRYSNDDNEIDDNDDDLSVDSINLTKARIERRKLISYGTGY